MVLVFSLNLMPYFYSCLMQWKTFLLFSTDHYNSQYSLISKARHILCGKGNQAAQKVWPDIQAQADDPTARLSKKPNSWGVWWGTKHPWGNRSVCLSALSQLHEVTAGLKTQEDKRDLNLPHPWFDTGKLQYPLRHTGTQGMFRTIEQSMSARGCWKILTAPHF